MGESPYTADTFGNFVDCLTVDKIGKSKDMHLVMGIEAFRMACDRSSSVEWHTPAGRYSVSLDSSLPPYYIEVR